jgi:hypothetical protein
MFPVQERRRQLLQAKEKMLNGPWMFPECSLSVSWVCPVQDGKERRRQLLQAKEKMLRKEEAKDKQKLRDDQVRNVS